MDDCVRPNKAKAGWLCWRKRLRTLETEALKNGSHRRTQPQTFGTGPASRPSPGIPASGIYLLRDVPAERRSSQASITRFAIPASASFPQARGSYAFLLPTSPSTFSTPS